MKDTITIDGYEFPKDSRFTAGADCTEIQHLNYHLEKKFNQFDVKDFLSRRHPELFPAHLGLWSDDNLNLKVVLWTRGHISPEGERDNSWHCSNAINAGEFTGDILEFYQTNDPEFFNFIKGRIIR